MNDLGCCDEKKRTELTIYVVMNSPQDRVGKSGREVVDYRQDKEKEVKILIRAPESIGAWNC